ncbi:MAG: cell division protein ZipA [Pseudomonadales bacterium]|nr:cell division protein ZipA [Pseudomonadales bacterium]
MSGRELVILLLGFAIVAVVLRGLYVAINARRGQIKLAISKNIPQDVDLEALELAELPGGGARVVTRSLEEVNRQNSALDLAETKAKTLNLADTENHDHIPVLMDAVELSQINTQSSIDELYKEPHEEPHEERYEEPAQAAELENQFDQQDQVEAYSALAMDAATDSPYNEAHEEPAVQTHSVEVFNTQVSQDPSIGEGWDDEDDYERDEAEAEVEAGDSYAAQQQTEAEYVDEGDTDSAFFDYEDDDTQEELESEERLEHRQTDTMSSVAPDYDDAEVDDATEDGFVEQLATDTPQDDSAQFSDDDGYAEDEFENDVDDYEETAEAELEEEPSLFDADSSADGFSMTAGERIGGNPPITTEVEQSELFDEFDEDDRGAMEKPKKRASLFSLFGRKSKVLKKKPKEINDAIESIEEPVAAVAEEAEELVQQELASEQWDEPDDVLFDDGQDAVAAEPAYDEPDYEEPAYEEEAYEEEIVDELDQKRAESSQPQAADPAAADEFEKSEVLVLNVTAKNGRVFTGDDLLHVLITSGLKFGEMNIFHKRLSKEHQGTVIFSVANMLNPGTFDLNNMDEFTTLGISFFLALPSAINNLDAFEQMLGVAQDIRDTLDGDLKDDHRNGMTAQTIEHYRQRVRDFELRRLKAVAARG